MTSYYSVKVAGGTVAFGELLADDGGTTLRLKRLNRDGSTYLRTPASATPQIMLVRAGELTPMVMDPTTHLLE